MNVKQRILLIINAGSTSTKVALYRDELPIAHATLRHGADELKRFASIWEQYEFRRNALQDWLSGQPASLADCAAVVSRGGLFRPVESGVYAISPAMLADAQSGLYGQHACGVGCKIAFDLGLDLGLPAFTVDPPCCDEMVEQARYTGLKGIRRRSVYHALNHKATGRKLAARLGCRYEDLTAVIAHLGGGISIAAHRQGRVIDVNNCLDGDGPFSPERAGTVPAGDLVSLCFSNPHAEDEIRRLLSGRGGLVAHLGLTDGQAIEKRIADGDALAKAVYDAMLHQVAKSIGAAAAVLEGQAAAIAITGGLAYSAYIVDALCRKIGWIAKVHVFPGENEMEALCLGALRCLRGEEEVKKY